MIRRLIASEFVTLDGVMEVPGHETHPDGKNQWVLQNATEDMQRFKVAELDTAGATSSAASPGAVSASRDGVRRG